ncbi:ubiquitin-conjugating enzyme/RWD-like protein [Boeremia exigua]|uniref:ubiquitin-conjugating enzyme/RWD-like protein n=1 Tax=Boeremia exigua TaxID=749465 RepID=UPI001E8E4410|nr:ubiquitin-conjugating enzyme/RWD-like protein [Boeremia exigua]KAH6622288.1 ubiquitin-conjugating enzyme/RWD-like protein [Boeremia exigua]
MASNRARRIAKEIADIKNDKLSQIIVDPAGNGDDLTHLRGQFLGPPDTPYEGGTFQVDIKIPNEYPFRPPGMKFETKIWHPNVSSQTVCPPLNARERRLTEQGAICLDTLASQWSPVLTIKSALISLQSLLSTPEPKDPQDAEVASMLIRNPAEFEHKAREWSVKYAGAPKKEIAEGSGGATAESIIRKRQEAKQNEEKVKMAAYHGYNKDLVDRFVAMGFDVEVVVAAFEYVGIDKMGGEDYELEEAYMGDITARLFGEA